MASAPAPETITIRWSLFRSLGLLILGLAITILAATGYTARRVASLTAEQLIGRTLERTRAEMARFFEPIERNLGASQGWAEAGLLDPDDPEGLVELFVPILRTHPQISAVSVGDARGRGMNLIRRPEGWITRRVDPSRHGRSVRMREWSASGAQQRAWTIEEPADDERFDPRDRAWYRVADEGARTLEPDLDLPQNVYWTDPYTFFTSSEPGISAAIHARAAGGERFVVALDVLLSDISDFTRSIEISPKGVAGILSADRRLIGLPRDPRFRDPKARRDALLQHPENVGVPLLIDAVRAREVSGTAPASELEVRPFTFQSAGQTHWAGSQVVRRHPDRRFAMVVIVPEGDLLGSIQRFRGAVAGATGAALLIAIFLALHLARRYGLPLAQLADQSERIRRLELGRGPSVTSNLRELSELANAQEGMRRALDSFARYVPTDIVRELLDRGDAAQIGGVRETLTILFTDVEGFTSLAEAMTPEELTAHMASYFEEMLSIIDREGTVDKLVGDAIVAFWGAPRRDPDHTRNGVEATLQCVERLDRLNADWRAAGLPALPTRFGLACGDVMVGNVGSMRRQSYTALGDAVNLASRLEGLNRIYGTTVLAAAPIPEQAAPGFEWRLVDLVQPKGKTRPVEIYELLGRRGAVPEARLRFARGYEEALGLYRTRRWSEAAERLQALRKEGFRNRSADRLLTVCNRLNRKPPPDDWQPVTVLDAK